MKNRFKLISLCILFFNASVYSQSNTSVGVSIGGGTISGKSPAIGSYYTNINFEFNPGFDNYLNTRITFIYSQDFSAIVPESRDRYYSFVKGLNLKLILNQYFESLFYLEEGAGLIILNDRTFNDTNVWDTGIIISLLGGIDLRKQTHSGIRLGLGTDFAITFTNTLAQLFSVYLQAQYMF